MEADVRGDVEQMLVHNLKTPLTGILATLEMLDDGDFGELAERQRAAVAGMQTQGEELLGLIDDLLEIWRAESPSPVLSLTPIEPAAFLQQLAAEWHPRFSRSGGGVSVVVAAGTPPFSGDAAVLSRVFGNLLMNGLVHAGDGATVRLTAEAGGAHEVVFGVADNGPGIPAQHAESVFGKFVRLESSMPPAGRRSSGLGLAFCRAAVTSHGGRIWVEPSEGHGATLRVTLPAHGVAPPGVEGRR